VLQVYFYTAHLSDRNKIDGEGYRRQHTLKTYGLVHMMGNHFYYQKRNPATLVTSPVATDKPKWKQSERGPSEAELARQQKTVACLLNRTVVELNFLKPFHFFCTKFLEFWFEKSF